MANALGSTPFGISQESWDITKLMLKIGVVGTVISIPVGIWAVKRWPDKPIVPAIILTGLGLVIKKVMISNGEREDPIAGDLHRGGESTMAGYLRPPAVVPSF